MSGNTTVTDDKSTANQMRRTMYFLLVAGSYRVVQKLFFCRCLYWSCPVHRQFCSLTFLPQRRWATWLNKPGPKSILHLCVLIFTVPNLALLFIQCFVVLFIQITWHLCVKPQYGLPGQAVSVRVHCSFATTQYKISLFTVKEQTIAIKAPD